MEIIAIHANNMNILRSMPDASFDIAFDDAPYGLGEGNRAASRTKRVVQGNGKTLAVNSRVHKQKDWDEEQPSQAYYNQLFRVAKKHFLFGENYLDFKQKNTSSGRYVWDKVNGNSDFSDAEIIWTNLEKAVRIFPFKWHGMMQAESILNGRTQIGDKLKNQRRIHPNEKPVKLYLHFLRKYVKPGMHIIDPHGGSGSIMLAFLEANIPDTKLLWIERDADYFTEAVERLHQEAPLKIYHNRQAEMTPIPSGIQQSIFV